MGGGSGLVNALQQTTGAEWYLSLERMRRIERIDPVSRLAVVEAGVVLQALHEAAQAQGLQFPVDLGARGSATLGGMVSTNAGGERVLRFGMVREQVLGLEVVLADGTVLDLMSEVLKNNAGYDLKQMFIGTEGTLGIVTRAVLRLRPAFRSRQAALLALPTLDRVGELLAHVERGLAGSLSALELMWPEFLHAMCAGPDAPHRTPLPMGAAGYVLVEAEGHDAARDAARFLATLESLLDAGLVDDAAIAQSDAERNAFWAIRNDVGRLVRTWSPAVAFDVSVPLRALVGYVDELRDRIAEAWPEGRVLAFGHVADDNVHLVITAGEATPERTQAISRIVYQGVVERRGSISAEHGIGLSKKAYLDAAAAPSVALMRRWKQLMDPEGLLNPGKVVDL